MRRPLLTALALLLLAVALAVAIANLGALPVLTAVALGLLGLCAVLAWVFVARHARTKWWATWEGRYMMRSKIAMALLFTVTLLGQAIPLRPLTAVSLSVLLFAWTAYVFADLIHMQTEALRSARALRAVKAEEARLRQARLERLHQHEQQQAE